MAKVFHQMTKILKAKHKNIAPDGYKIAQVN